jgi:integrase
MASLYKRTDSKFWWVSLLDVNGRRVCKSTGLKHAIPAETRRARDLERELTLAEQERQGPNEHWDAWVPQFLQQRYEEKPESFKRYTTIWRNLRAFLGEKNLHIPRALTRQDVRAYIDWRQVAHDGIYAAGKNTALLEIKVLGLIMQEAIANEFAASNPCHKLGISRASSVPKPRISDAEHAVILKALDKEPGWMQVSYRIAWEQGCRFSETHMEMSTQVDLARNIVRLRTKGQKDTLAEFPMAPALRPMFEKFKREGRKWTYEMPNNTARQWHRFFRKIKLGHLCFHSTRVTFITRCYEQGLSREAAMRLAGHSNEAVHSVYPRLTADDQLLQQMRSLV